MARPLGLHWSREASHLPGSAAALSQRPQLKVSRYNFEHLTETTVHFKLALSVRFGFSNQSILKEISPGCSLEGLIFEAETPIL